MWPITAGGGLAAGETEDEEDDDVESEKPAMPSRPQRTHSAPAGLHMESDITALLPNEAEGQQSVGSTDADDSAGQPFLLAPPKRQRPPASAKEWRKQNKRIIRGDVTYVETDEDRAEKEAARQKEI